MTNALICGYTVGYFGFFLFIMLRASPRDILSNHLYLNLKFLKKNTPPTVFLNYILIVEAS